MSAVDDALDLIMRKCPDLAEQAGKQRVRPSARLRTKGASSLAVQALSGSYELSKKDRALLASVVESVEDDTLTDTLPPVRVSRALMQSIEEEAETSGRSMSDVIRGRLSRVN